MGAELTLNLGSINLSGNVWSLGAVSIGSTAKGVSVSVASDHAMTQTLKDGYGTLKVDADSVLTFAGGSGLGGEVSLGSNTSSLSQISFSAAVQTTIGANEADSIHLRTVNTSSGKDTIYVGGYAKDLVLSTGAGDDFVSVAANEFDRDKGTNPHGGNNFISTGTGNDTIISHSGASIDAGAGNDVVSVMAGNWSRGLTLGAGKDTLVFVNGAAASSVNLQDYNFNDDLIQAAADAYAGATLDNKGTLKLGYGDGDPDVVFGLGATNSLYLARVANKDNNTTVYATAEEDASKVVIDASTIKKEEAVVIDATSADSANITLGKASTVAVSLNAAKDAGVDTITIGDTKANASITVTNFNTDDVLNFTGLTFDKTTISADESSNVTLSSGKISLNLGTAATVTGGAKFNLNGTTIYATTANNSDLVLTDETDLSKVLIKGQLKDDEISGIITSAKLVDLGAVNINNIDRVSLTADAVAGTSLIGTKNKKNGVTLNASAATDGVAVWTNNSENVLDIIELSTAENAVDTLHFGTTDGKDSVNNFQLASDILYLRDATSMTADNGIITVGKASLNVSVAGASATTEEIMQVQGAQFAPTFYVAGDFTTDADGIYLGENAGKVNYYAIAKDESISVTASEAINYTFLKDIDYAGATKANIAANGSVASINASGVDSTDSKIIIEGVANVSLGAGTNEVWVNGAAKDATVVLSTTKEGTDKVWFGASDKNVTVTNFDTESDVIALMGSIGEFSAKKDETSGNVVISNASKKSLTLDAATSNVSLVDAAGAKYKLFVDTAEYTTNTDGTNIYLAGDLTAGSDVTGATNIVVEGANNNWGIASSAIVGKAVKNINMSGSSADFILIGSANAANTITGGTGTNYLNGGGASKDTLNGVTGAVDYFYYGKEDGNDTLVNVGAEDTVVLYDIATTDLAATPKVTDEKTVITLNNDSKLTIEGSIEGLTFQLTDGTYKYDSSADEKWVKQ